MSRGRSALGMSRGRYALGVAAVALLGWPWWSRATSAGEPGLSGRLFGPVASLAASVEWVRFGMALQRGDTERAYALAARALALDPRSAAGWTALAQHLAFDRAAATSERDPERRVTWAAAALAVLREGEAASDEPGELAVIQGDLSVFLSDRVHEDLPWPGGRAPLLDAAREHYARAARLGHPEAADRAARLAEFLAREKGAQPGER